jgi:hypothetical protein
MARVPLSLIPSYTVSGSSAAEFAGAGSPLGAIAVLQLIPGVEITNGALVAVFNINFDFSSADSSVTLGIL